MTMHRHASVSRKLAVFFLALATVGCFKKPTTNVASIVCQENVDCLPSYVCKVKGVAGGCCKPDDTSCGLGSSTGGSGGSATGGSSEAAGASGGAGGGTSVPGTGGSPGTGGIVEDGGATGTGGAKLGPDAGSDAGSGGSPGTGGIVENGGATGTDGAKLGPDAGSDVPIVITCPAPQTPLNGTVIAPSFDIGSTASYACAMGYAAPTPSFRTCQADGTWSGTVPVCQLIDCHTPPAIDFGSVSATTTTYGATADYACTNGYLLSGTSRRLCQADGTWSGTAATCSLVDCHAPPPIEHGTVSAPLTTYGAAADYSCATSYVLSGISERMCQADGTWSATAPSCVVPTAKVTVILAGSALGTVTSSPAGIQCGTSCETSFPVGTSVTLSATASSGQSFFGWDSQVCSEKGTCVLALASDTVVKAVFTPPPNIMFVTSTAQTAALGGLSGADGLCMTRAQAAGLSGTYKAWLSSSTVNAKDRVGAASGWVRPDGKAVLNRIADIENNLLFYPPRLDESGKDVGSQWVLTGTGGSGVRQADPSTTTCGDFTSGIGDGVTYIEGGWSSANSMGFASGLALGCSLEARIYCLGVDRTAVVGLDSVATGRRAFTSTGRWAPGGGITTADALCQSEATAAALPGTYKALLPPTGDSAASRFNASGAPWIRSDGVPLAASASAFFSATQLDVAPNIGADGKSHFWNIAWSGAHGMTATATSDNNCSNWLSPSGTALTGSTDNTGWDYFFGSSVAQSCNTTLPVVCLQE